MALFQNIKLLLAFLVLFFAPSLAAADSVSPWDDGLYHVVWKKKPSKIGCIDVTPLVLAENDMPIYGCRTGTDRDSWRLVHGDKLGKTAYRDLNHMHRSYLPAVLDRRTEKKSWHVLDGIGREKKLPLFQGTLVTDGVVRYDLLYEDALVDTSTKSWMKAVEAGVLLGGSAEGPVPSGPSLPMISVGKRRIRNYVMLDGKPLYAWKVEPDAGKEPTVAIFHGDQITSCGHFNGTHDSHLTIAAVGGKPFVAGLRDFIPRERRGHQVVCWGDVQIAFASRTKNLGIRYSETTATIWGKRPDGSYIVVEGDTSESYNEVRNMVFHGTRALYAARRLGGSAEKTE